MKINISGIPDRSFGRCRSFLRYLIVLLAFITACVTVGEVGLAAVTRCVVIEVYYRSGDRDHVECLAAMEEFRATHRGITVHMRDLQTDVRNQERLNSILKHFKIAPTMGPVIYGCNRVIHDTSASGSWTSQLQQMTQMEVYVRTGCSRCASAKQWLPTFMKEYPGLTLVYRDIAVDSASATRLTQLVERYRTAAASVPVFHLCNTLVVGFDRVESTGERLRSLLKPWTHECPKAEKAKEPPKENVSGAQCSSHRIDKSSCRPEQATRSSGGAARLPEQRVACSGLRLLHSACALSPFLLSNHFATGILTPDAFRAAGQTEGFDEARSPDSQPPPTDELPWPLPLPGDDLPIRDSTELALPGAESDSRTEEQADDLINLPIFGKVRASTLGMPLFTIAVGLVDGFNPCAMWVLLFLLSILVNLRDRTRILAIAGTFVVVSGLAYFAFMAAWLNVFLLIGYLRPIQIGLALMAIVIGSIHIKDFFAFKKGISLSIPESAKPGIYDRVRRIVTAEHLAGAVAGAITLAILVNLVELLCTAGLPALYTNILMQQGYSAPMRYAYLSLYIVAYMFDDSLMVLVVVWTLSKRKLQEAQGRWLKLISGLAILLLGIIMLFRPGLLQ
jgi:hypothetical protein